MTERTDMNRPTLGIIAPILVLALATMRCPAEAPQTISGRTIAQYASQLTDADRVVRLRAIKSLGAFGNEAGEAIELALDHEDAAMRYTAAVHLGRIGGAPLSRAGQRLAVLATDKTSHAVRMAASFALCKAGKTEQHLPLLIESLSYPERGMACSAAELIGRLGPDAIAAEGRLEDVYAKHRPGTKGGDYHIGGAAKNALRKIQNQSSENQ
jgi:HEAT repeat protein